MHMKRCFRAEAIWKIIIQIHHVFGIKNEYDILLPCMSEVQPTQKEGKAETASLMVLSLVSLSRGLLRYFQGRISYMG